MIAYNISIKIDRNIEEDWVRWQQQEHIPDIMGTGLFSMFKFFKLLEETDDGTATYVVQYFASTLEDYQQYRQQFAPGMSEKAFDRWGDRFIAFRSVMQVVD